MKTIAKNAFGLATLLVLAAQPAAAHRFWIIPSASVFSGENQWVTVDAAISNNLFFANHVSAPLQAITPGSNEHLVGSVMSPSFRPSISSHAFTAARWIAGYLVAGMKLPGSLCVACIARSDWNAPWVRS